jgi:phosphoglycolate phosphatase-like HAD superfamily hydrolase
MIRLDSGTFVPRCRTWLFDCDGVLLNSNHAKTEAMRQAALPYGEEAAQALVAYHRAHGGISRFEKIRHLFTDILQRAPREGEIEDTLLRFAKASRAGLLHAETADRLFDVLGLLKEQGINCLVVSGGDQQELRDVFGRRQLDNWFCGIFGSPDRKEQIIERELAKGLIELPAMFVGDSRYDYESAACFGFHFTFMTAWSEFTDWDNFFADKEVIVAKSISDLFFGPMAGNL